MTHFRTPHSRTAHPRSSSLRRTGGLLLVAVLGLAPLAAGNGAASASDDDRVITTGACSGSSDWKLKAKEDDGRIEVEGEIDTSRSGETWSWKLKHNGSVSARGTAVTTSRSGSFSVERRTVDVAGTDSFVFRATNPRTGERCVARVSY